MKIYNKKQELADWIRRKLGAPIIDVPLEESQLDDVIDDTVQYFGEHAGGIGNEEQYILINVCEDRDWENNGSMPSLEEGNCDEYDVSTVSGTGAYKRYQAEYQLPRNVVSLMQEFPGGSGALSRDADLLTYGTYGAGVGAVNALSSYGMGYYMAGASFGNRSGSSHEGSALIGFEIGMQYLEMWRQRYTIKMRAQFMEQTRKVRFSPMPHSAPNGQILLGVWARVADEWLYENIWVKNYALALAKLQVASNLSLFGNMAYPGGVQLNYEVFQTQGQEEKEKLEQEIVELKYNYPPDFIVG